jgi:hypothetical protein
MPVDPNTHHIEATMRMIDRQMDQLPRQGAALPSAGAASWGNVDALIDVLNGHPDRPLRHALATTACAVAVPSTASADTRSSNVGC